MLERPFWDFVCDCGHHEPWPQEEMSYGEILRKLKTGEANAVLWTHDGEGEGEHENSPNCWCAPEPSPLFDAEGV